MVQIAQARFGLVTIPVLQLQEMAPAQVLQNPSPAQLLPQDLSSRHKPNPVLDPNYDRFAQAPETGASCWSIASGAGIELADFYKWNTVLGTGGENCNTQIWPNYYYCVRVAGTTPSAPVITSSAPTTTSSAPKPTKTQTGYPTNCTKWVETKDGDSCWAIANANGIDSTLFYSLNAVLGEGGANCETQIWPTYLYCVAT